MIAEAGRLGTVRQALVNPSDECLWNLLSACSNTGGAPTASCCKRICCEQTPLMHLEAVQCGCSAGCACSCRSVCHADCCTGCPQAPLGCATPLIVLSAAPWSSRTAQSGIHQTYRAVSLQATWRCWRCC